ncbi:MAG: hypothetical protein EAX95_12755 [Candidatus Thorarchaeota archaeon]|nr:hypothetical protein [Candidatus Thorarchaeota archaeon]
MAKKTMKPFACPACSDGTLVNLEVEESVITESKRFPVMVTARCPKKHSLVVFIDNNFQVRDVQAAADATDDAKGKEDTSDALDKAKGWFDSL